MHPRVQIRFLRPAAGPFGLAFAGEVLRVHPELATRYCAGETPAAELIHEPVSAANAESGDEALLEVLKQ